MSVRRIVALVFIYALGCAGWWILGTCTERRSGTAASELGGQVESLWGTPLVQPAPRVSVAEGEDPARARPVLLAASTVRVELRADPRRKGLVWYPTFVCRFAGDYTVVNEEAVRRRFEVHFDFPAPGGTYDAFEFQVGDGSAVVPVNTKAGIDRAIDLAPGESRRLRIAYTCRGLGQWRYRVDPSVGRLRNLDLVVKTDFVEVDYPEGSLSPMRAEPGAGGATLAWQATDLITTQDIGVTAPQKLNPGPLTTRITFFAPVCLLFFFVLITTLGIVRGIPIHPMHYLFVTGGFFAFHLLLAYLVDHVDIHAAFAGSAATSIGLVTVYLGTALGRAFPCAVCVVGQVFFLVLFSYSFFLEGTTGLTVALGSVATLATLMKVTAKVNWEDYFSGKPGFPVGGPGSAASGDDAGPECAPVP